MLRTATKKKKGFTLIELIVVLAIIMFTTAVLSGGVAFLQNSISLDNSIRQLKSELQATQNLARNSFFSGYSEENSSEFLDDKRVSVGWLMTMDTVSNPNAITVLKRSIYVMPPHSNIAQYDYANLRKDIITLRKDLSGLKFVCDSVTNELRTNTINGLPVKFAKGTSSEVTVYCTEESEATRKAGEVEKRSVLERVTLSDPILLPASSLPMCFEGTSQLNVFFTSGYGEPATSLASTCQIRIQSTSSNYARSYRGLKFDSVSGGGATCGSYCE
jgi:type II secretory pathway pseudopilin PulG